MCFNVCQRGLVVTSIRRREWGAVFHIFSVNNEMLRKLLKLWLQMKMLILKHTKKARS